MRDYSQRGEQDVILETLGYRRDGSRTASRGEPLPPAAGRFLDIGAYDGVRYSNTRALALLGWAGVCVEAAAWAFDRLALLYHDQPDIELVQALVHVDDRTAPLPAQYASGDATTTTDPEHARLWTSNGTRYRRVWMATIGIPQLLAAFPGPYRLISIDTERTSAEIAMRMIVVAGGLDRLGCDILVVEHDDRQQDILDLAGDGYEAVLENGENLILARHR